MTVEPIDWEDLGAGSAGFDVNNFVVELEGQPTPEGIAQRLAETQNKKNQIIIMLQHVAVDIEYKQALLKIEKARALQSAVGTVQQREAFAQDATQEDALKTATMKGKAKMLHAIFDNLNSAQIALSSQIKTLNLQNDLIRD